MLIGQSFFEYRFAVTTGEIAAESLKEIPHTRQKLHFARNDSDALENRFEPGFYQKHKADVDFPFLQFVARGTRANQNSSRTAPSEMDRTSKRSTDGPVSRYS